MHPETGAGGAAAERRLGGKASGPAGGLGLELEAETGVLREGKVSGLNAAWVGALGLEWGHAKQGGQDVCSV